MYLADIMPSISYLSSNFNIYGDNYHNICGDNKYEGELLFKYSTILCFSEVEMMLEIFLQSMAALEEANPSNISHLSIQLICQCVI